MTTPDKPPAVVGIDPGRDGGIAIIPLTVDDLRDVVPTVYRMPLVRGTSRPSAMGLTAMIHPFDVQVAAVEAATAFGMCPRDAMTYGAGIGVVLAVLDLEGAHVERPTPRQWQRVVGCTGKPRPGRRSIETAILATDRIPQVVPRANLYPGRCTKPHSGIADALGIAIWARAALGLRRG